MNGVPETTEVTEAGGRGGSKSAGGTRPPPSPDRQRARSFKTVPELPAGVSTQGTVPVKNHVK
ncbi:hypothetical protein PAL_GLEAN10007754 [Pteropus alecto]|uniref:Uncharacterized protein n=1 Tax=Pteropus alecto TaxID=9402 RepID=L5KH55_PTEAL|nr:hypothetical protein PAL_GLEAN10007754 [Pteropus alecto]